MQPVAIINFEAETSGTFDATIRMNREATFSYDHVKFEFNTNGGFVPQVTKKTSHNFNHLKLLKDVKVTGTAKVENSKYPPLCLDVLVCTFNLDYSRIHFRLFLK